MQAQAPAKIAFNQWRSCVLELKMELRNAPPYDNIQWALTSFHQ